jgi:hypothetical protein
VLDHPIASFSPTSALASFTYDFGTVSQGASVGGVPLSITNYAGAGAPSFASALDLDSIVPSGASGALSLTLAPFAGLGQGLAQGFFAAINTTASGAFSATYLLNLSGENLPGDVAQQLSLTLTGTVAAAVLAGDYSGDGVIDAADYTVWQDTLGSSIDLAADGDGSGTVDAADYTVWVAHYGESAPATAIPEPTSLLLASFAVFAVAARFACPRAQNR